MEVGLGPGHIVLDGDRSPRHRKGHSPPTLRPMFIVAKRLDGSRCHLVQRIKTSAQATLYYMGTQLPFLQEGHSPQFSVYVYCGQTVANLSS